MYESVILNNHPKCPYCGSVSVLKYDDIFAQVTCSSCDVSSRIYFRKNETDSIDDCIKNAIEEWDRSVGGK